jgi:hypothetical protein
MTKEVSENKKVRNARRVDIRGTPIKNLTEFRKDNPDALHFDSELERYCYLMFEENGLNPLLKPPKIIIVPAISGVDWDYTAEQWKDYRDLQRGVTAKSEKSANTRMFNLGNSKSLVVNKMPAWTWSPDILLEDYLFYVDTKGNKKDAHWRNKLKAARHLLKAKKAGYEVIQLQTKKEIKEFTKHLLQNEPKPVV